MAKIINTEKSYSRVTFFIYFTNREFKLDFQESVIYHIFSDLNTYSLIINLKVILTSREYYLSLCTLTNHWHWHRTLVSYSKTCRLFLKIKWSWNTFNTQLWLVLKLLTGTQWFIFENMAYCHIHSFSNVTY